MTQRSENDLLHERQIAPAPKLPKVSVAICNFNYGRYVQFAVESALSQTYLNCELIVVDDGSTDDSPKVIEELCKKHPRIKAVYKQNEGQNSAYNSAFSCCTGDIVIFLDSDDALCATTAERIAQQWNEELSKLHFKLSLIDENNRPIGGDIPRILEKGRLARSIYNERRYYCSSPGSGNAYSRRFLEQVMPLPTGEDKHGADFYLIHAAALWGLIAAIDERLGFYRVHNRQDRLALTFGNAAQRGNEIEKVRRRYSSFRRWISERLPGQPPLPEEIHDFSLLKLAFAATVLEAETYFKGAKEGAALLPAVIRSLRHKPGRPLERIALGGWAIAVWVLPRRMAHPLARYVCNPASRGTRVL